MICDSLNIQGFIICDVYKICIYLSLICFQVTYSDLAAVIQRKDSMEFLHDIVPKKIKYSDFLKLVEDSKDEEDDLF